MEMKKQLWLQAAAAQPPLEEAMLPTRRLAVAEPPGGNHGSQLAEPTGYRDIQAVGRGTG